MARRSPLEGPLVFQSSDWIRKIRNGDHAAFESLFRTFAPGLCTFVVRYVESRAAAEDLVQDLFLTLWKRRADVEITGSVETYLFSAAKNRALNHLRHERVQDRFRTAFLTRWDAHSTTRESEFLELLEVQEAIESLPARCRLVFTLSRHQGLTYVEIATSLGLSTKTVETQMGRALKVLRTRLLDKNSDGIPAPVSEQVEGEIIPLFRIG